MSKQVSLVQDVLSKYTHSVLVHDEKSVAAFGVTKGAQRWAGWATENVKSFDEAMNSLAANFASTPIGYVNTKTVLEMKNILSADLYAQFLQEVDDDILRPEQIDGKSLDNHLISGRVQGRRGSAERSVLERPLHTFAPDQQQAIVEFKANRFWTEQKQTALAIEVKRVRAVFDRNIGPGGGWRCPDGTMYGGRITDRFGRGCGGSLTRRIGRAIMNAGRQADNAVPPTNRRLERAARRGARQAARAASRDRRRVAREAQRRRDIGEMMDMVDILVGDYLPADGERGARGGLRPRDALDIIRAVRRNRDNNEATVRSREEVARRRRRGRDRDLVDDLNDEDLPWEPSWERPRRPRPDGEGRRPRPDGEGRRPRPDEEQRPGPIGPPPDNDFRPRPVDPNESAAERDKRRREREEAAARERERQRRIEELNQALIDLGYPPRGNPRRPAVLPDNISEKLDDPELSNNERQRLWDILRDYYDNDGRLNDAGREYNQINNPPLMGGRIPAQGGRSRRRETEPRPLRRRNNSGRRRETRLTPEEKIRGLSDQGLLDEIDQHEQILYNEDTVLDDDQIQSFRDRYPELLREADRRGLIDRDTGRLGPRPETPSTPRRQRVGSEPDRRQGLRESARRGIRSAVRRLVGDYTPADGERGARGGRRRVGRDREGLVDDIVDRVADAAEDMLRDQTGRAREGRSSDNRRDRRNAPRTEASQELAERVERAIRDGLNLPEKDPDAAPGDANEDRDISDAARQIARDITPDEDVTPDEELIEQARLRREQGEPPTRQQQAAIERQRESAQPEPAAGDALPPPDAGDRLVDQPDTPDSFSRRRRQMPGVRPPRDRRDRARTERRETEEASPDPMVEGQSVFRDMSEENLGDLSESSLSQTEQVLDDIDMGLLPKSRRERAIENLVAIRSERQRRTGVADGEKPVSPPKLSKRDRKRAFSHFGASGLPKRAWWNDDDVIPQQDSRWGALIRQPFLQFDPYYDDNGELNDLGRALNREIRGFAEVETDKLHSSTGRRLRPETDDEAKDRFEESARLLRELDVERELPRRDLEKMTPMDLARLEREIIRANTDGRLDDNLQLIRAEYDRRSADVANLRPPQSLIDSGRRRVEIEQRAGLDSRSFRDESNGSPAAAALRDFLNLVPVPERVDTQYAGDESLERQASRWDNEYVAAHDVLSELRRRLPIIEATARDYESRYPDAPNRARLFDLVADRYRQRIEYLESLETPSGIDDVDNPDGAYISTDPDTADIFAYIEDLIDKEDLRGLADLTTGDDEKPDSPGSRPKQFFQSLIDRFDRAVREGDLADAQHALSVLADATRQIDGLPREMANTDRSYARLRDAIREMRPRSIPADLWERMVRDSDRPELLSRFLPAFMEWRQSLDRGFDNLGRESSFRPEGVRRLPVWDGRYFSGESVARELFEDRFGISTLSFNDFFKESDRIQESYYRARDNIGRYFSRMGTGESTEQIKDYVRTMGNRLTRMLLIRDSVQDPAVKRAMTDRLEEKAELFLLGLQENGFTSIPYDLTPEEVANVADDLSQAGRRIEERILGSGRQSWELATPAEIALEIEKLENMAFPQDHDRGGPVSRLSHALEQDLSRAIAAAPDATDDGDPAFGGLAQRRREILDSLAEDLQRATARANLEILQDEQVEARYQPGDLVPRASAAARRKFTDRLRDAWKRRRATAARDYSGDVPWNDDWRRRFEDLQDTISVGLNELGQMRLDNRVGTPEYFDTEMTISDAEDEVRAMLTDVFAFEYETRDGFKYRTTAQVSGSSRSGYSIQGGIKVTDENGDEHDVGYFSRMISADTISMDSFKIYLHDLEEGSDGSIFRSGSRAYVLDDNGLTRQVDIYDESRWSEMDLRAIAEVNNAYEDAGNPDDRKKKVIQLPSGKRAAFVEKPSTGRYEWMEVIPNDRKTSRGGGFGTAFNYRVWNFANQMGIRRAKVSAGYDDGPYAWGRFGYKVDSEFQTDSLWDAVQRAIDLFEQGRPSVIENIQQARMLRSLLDEYRLTSTDLDERPQFMEAIYALEMNSEDPDRLNAVRGWMKKENVYFNRGVFYFDDRVIFGGEEVEGFRSTKTIEGSSAVQGFVMNGGVRAAPLRPGVVNPAVPGSSNSSRPRNIANPQIRTVDDAIELFNNNGGNLEEIPNFAWGQVLEANSSTSPRDTRSRYFKEPPRYGRNDVMIYRLRDADGNPTNQGFVIKSSEVLANQAAEDGPEYQFDLIEHDIIGHNLAVQLGVVPFGATWDGEDSAGRPQIVMPFAAGMLPDGAAVLATPDDVDQFADEAFVSARDVGAPARIQNQLFGWILGLADRGPNNAAVYRHRQLPTADNPNPDPDAPPSISIAPLDFGRIYTPYWAESQGMSAEQDPMWDLFDYKERMTLDWYMQMTPSGLQDSRLPQHIFDHYEALKELDEATGAREAEAFRQRVISVVEEMREKARLLRAMTVEDLDRMRTGDSVPNAAGDVPDYIGSPELTPYPRGFSSMDEWMAYLSTWKRGMDTRIDLFDEVVDQVNNWFTGGRPMRPQE